MTTRHNFFSFTQNLSTKQTNKQESIVWRAYIYIYIFVVAVFGYVWKLVLTQQAKKKREFFIEREIYFQKTLE